MAKEPFASGITIFYCPSVSLCHQSFEVSAVVGVDNLTRNCVVSDVLKHCFVPFGALLRPFLFCDYIITQFREKVNRFFESFLFSFQTIIHVKHVVLDIDFSILI